jgi:DNA-binding response OmpR family regulator
MPKRFQPCEQWNSGFRTAHEPARVLVVDDHTDTLEVVAMLLTLHGYRVATASNGVNAMSAVPGFKPDLLLLDITLPDMSGVDVLRSLRGAGVTCPAIALTALAFDTDKKAYREAGFDAFCSKPADIDQLLHIVRDVTRGGGRASPACVLPKV